MPDTLVEMNEMKIRFLVSPESAEQNPQCPAVGVPAVGVPAVGVAPVGPVPAVGVPLTALGRPRQATK